MRPARTFREAPPSRDAVTTSFTCPDFVDVKTLTSSGMIAPASVPHVMTAPSFHQRVPSPSSGIRRYETTNVMTTETREVIQTREVRGASKSILSAFANRAFAIASLIQYEQTLATIIMMRIAKSQTRSLTCVGASGTARRMNEMSATPVTP